MKTLLKDISKDQIISVGDLSKYIIQDRNRSIQEYVNEQVALKRQTPMKCWSMDNILQLIHLYILVLLKLSCPYV